MNDTDKFQQRSYPVLTENIYQDILNCCREEGYSITEIAAKLNVSECKLCRWRTIDERLDEILTLGRTYSKGWWMAQGRKHLRNGKDFQFNIWIAMMKNSFEWGDRPSERPFKVINWDGSIEQKINIIDEMLRNGEIAFELYEHIMKALHYHSQINEICYIKPQLERLELERKLYAGEISQVQFDKELELWEEANKLRDIAADRLLKKEKIIQPNENLVRTKRKVKRK